MKTKHLALALLAIVPLSLLLADDVPKSYAFERYQGMMERSPFAVATAVAAPSATPNFAKDLYVANAAHSKDFDLVTIASSADKSFKKFLSTEGPEDGYTITNIEWSEKVGATKVTIAKEGQTATLTFNEALLRQSAPNQPPQAQAQPAQMVQPQFQPQAQPIVPPPVNAAGTNGVAPNTNVTRPMPVPSLPTPPARVRGVIPKNPNAAMTPVPSQPATPEPEL
jgi:hypothetical protein